MQKQLLISALGLLGFGAFAQDLGTVLSSTPIMQTVGVPQQTCHAQQVAVQQPKSGAGALLGAIAGGAVGNALGGHGAGNAAATALGLVGGAVLGDHIEGDAPAQVQTVQQCSTQTVYESRPVAYNVIYTFGGKQYSVQLPQDPGPTIAVQVTPAGALPQQAAPTVASTAPVVIQQGYYVQPYYPAPYYYPPVALDFRFGGGYRHWR